GCQNISDGRGLGTHGGNAGDNHPSTARRDTMRSALRENGGLTRRRLFALTAGAAAGAALPAAWPLGEPALGAAEKRGGTLTVGVNTDLVSLDPNDIVFANVPMFFQVYDYLVKYSATLQPRPGLAEFWDLAKDGMSVVFRLRDGVRTHSGG